MSLDVAGYFSVIRHVGALSSPFPSRAVLGWPAPETAVLRFRSMNGRASSARALACASFWSSCAVARQPMIRGLCSVVVQRALSSGIPLMLRPCSSTTPASWSGEPGGGASRGSTGRLVTAPQPEFLLWPRPGLHGHVIAGLGSSGSTSPGLRYRVVGCVADNNAMNLTNREVPGLRERRASGEPEHG